MSKIKFLYSILIIFSILFSNSTEEDVTKKDKIKGIDAEFSTSSYVYKDASITGEFNGIRTAIIGKYNGKPILLKSSC